MFKAKLNISAAIILFLSLMSSTVFSAVLLGPEFVNSNSGRITTFVKTLNLGDNLPGKYLLKLQNGSNGPALLQLCDTKPTIELKRQCQYENLVDRIENQLTRLNSLTIKVNGQLISTTSLLNKSTSYLEFPINLNLSINEIKISVLGNPEAFASVQIEELPAEALPPRALFSINSNRGRAPFILKYNATQSFDPLNKALTYQWFVDDVQISDLKIGSYTLQNPGESILKLKVTNSDGATSELSTVIMTLNPIVPATNLRPIPKLIVSYPDPLNLRLVKVSALDSYDPDGMIVKTEINWGDTFKSLSSEALHQFATDGTFLVSVRVTDDLGLVSAIEKSVPISLNTQLSKVSSLFGPNTYYGSFSAYNDYVETINLSAIDAAELYRVKIKNADGKDHLVRICSGTVSENIMCAYNNLLSRAYIALYRVDYANIYINNKKITDSTSINKNQKSFSTYLKLAEINQLKIRLKGWPTAYIDVEIEKLGQVADTTPPVLSSNVDSGTNTRSNLVHIYVEDNSLVTTEIYKNDVLVATATTDEFDLTLSEGVNNFVLKAKDTENNVAADFILSNITLDSTPPIPSQMDLKAKYIFTTLPQTVTLNFSTNEDLSSATANGEALTQISQTQYQYQIQVFDPVKTVVQVRFKDLVGNEGVGNYSFLTEIDVTNPILTMSALPVVTKASQISASFSVTEKNTASTVIKVNGDVVATSIAKSFNQIIPLTDESLNTIEAISTDVVGNVSNIITRQITKDSTGPQLSLTPANDAVIPTLTAIISGTSNEPMTQVLVAGKTAVLSADKLSFSYNYVATTYGIKNLAIQAKDVLGNISVQNISYNVNNSTIPVITTNITNGSVTNNQNIQVNAIGTGINSLQVLLDDQELLNQDQTSFSFLVTGDGEHKVDVIAKNTAGHITSQTYNFTFDTTAPFINLTSGVVGQTTEDLITVSYSFWDLSATTFRVMAGQTIIYQSTESVGTFDIPLLTQGTHRISVFAMDAANNMSEPLIFEIIKDNTNPIVTILSPTANELIDGNQIKVKALVDDPVANVTVNGQAMTWDDTEAAWTGTLVANSTDDFLITVLATNTLNLIGESSVTVKPLLSPLVPALLGLYEDAINQKMLVKGAAGSTRPFLNVKIKSGIFSSEIVQADKNGSFMASLDIKDEYTVVVDDPLTGIEHKHKLTKFLQQTILSGLVKDNNDMPLEGVVVSIASSNMQATTNQSGVFAFRTSDFPDSRVTGDQVITIDGRNVGYAQNSRPKKYSITKLNFSMSYKQNNIIQNTIYLYPTYQDTLSTLSSVGGGEITSPDAQGVVLSVPLDVNAIFPSGSTSEAISMFTVSPEKTTIKPPSSIQAKNIIVLEPSGTTFSESVDLTIPNFSSFPAETKMYFLLFNSKTGEWEIGGAGAVTADGQSVKTDIGSGIRHFSDVLAIPTSPDILGYNLPNKPGADSFSGANAAKIDLPSFKVLGNSVSPSLIYKSTWAKPSTTVTNIFNFAETDIQLDPFTDNQTQNVKYQAKERKCSKRLGLWTDCHDEYKETYESIKIDTEYTNLVAMISPKRVDVDFITADVKPPKRSFANIPRLAQISNFFELKNQNNQYLQTGLYPYNAHYTINYDQLIVGTSRTKYYSEITGAVDETKPYDNTIPNQVFGTDLFESLYVQNYRNSEAGQGWKIGGVQKIVNPTASKIMIDEADGSISTYDFDNTISTIVNFDDINGDSNLGISLNEWPKFAFTDKTTKEIKVATPSGQNFSLSIIGSQPKIEGRSSGHTYSQKISQGAAYPVYVCDQRLYFPTGNICVLYHYETAYYENQSTNCSQNNFTYKQDVKPSQFLTTSNGAYVIDQFRHSLGYIGNSQFIKLSGTNYPVQNHYTGRVVPNTSTPSPFDYYSNLDTQQFNGLMDSFSGVTKTSTNIRNESYNYFADCNSNAIIQQNAVGDELAGAGELNNPSSIIQSLDQNILIIANTGLSNIATFNITNNEIKYIAGNGTANDTDDNLLAINAGIANPRGLAYDNNGNLFVSTSLGHIRKIAADGTITTIAGNALNGLYVSEAEPLKMLLNNPYGLAFDAQSNSLFVADSGYNRIIKIDFNSNRASTVVGNNGGQSDEASNNPLKIALSNPTHLKIDQNRNLIIVDSGNKKIRKMNIDKLSGSGEKKYLSSIKDYSTLTKKADGTFIRTYRDGRKENFDALGKNISSVAANGLAVQFQYNTQNHLEKIVFPNQQEVSYNYSQNRLSSIFDISGRETQFNYNGLGQLTAVNYSDGTGKQFEYDADGLLTKETNQKGFYKNFVYNQFDRLEKVVDSTGVEVKVKDSASKNMADKDVSGNTIPKNSGNNNDVMIDPNGNQIVFSKDLDGFLSKITDPQGRTKTVKRDSEGRVLEITDVDGSVVQNKYDPNFGDLIEAKNVTLNITAQKAYNANGLVISETDPYGKISERQYNQKLQLVSQIQPDGKYNQLEYNSLGLVTAKSDFNSAGVLQSKMIYDYNLQGQLIKQTNLDGKFTTYTYDLAGNVLTSTVNVANSETAMTAFQYDEMNRLIKVISPKNETTEYKYSSTGELIEIKDPKQKVTSFEYNQKGKLTKRIDPKGAINLMTYDNNGNMLTETDPANQLKKYKYNTVNKLTEIQTVDDLISYNYTVKDEVISMANTSSSVLYTRDVKQRITSETVSATSDNVDYTSHTISYNYSLNDLRTQMTSPFQNISYFYNQNNYQLTGIQNSFGESFAFNYDQANRISSIQRPGSRTDFNYDVGSSLTSIIHSASTSIKSSFEYQYDLRSYITQKRSPSSTLNYTYDSNGQLTNSDKAKAPAENEAFSYDALGNRLTYNGLNSAYDLTGQKILDDGNYTYLYDLNGNILAKNSKTNGVSFGYEYTALNQIKNVNILANPSSISALKKIKYFYDPVGRRISKSVIDFVDSNQSYTKKFYFDDTNIIAELDSDDNLLATYTHRPETHDDILSAKFSSHAVSPTKGGTAISEGQVLSDRLGSVYFAKDYVNSVSEILDANGNIIQKYDYSAFGVIKSIKNNLNQVVNFENAPIRTSFTFTGREYEPETKTYHFRARQYDPSIGRFLQQDPDPGKIKSPRSFLTKYAYVENVPTMFNDPTGKFISGVHGNFCGYSDRGVGRDKNLLPIVDYMDRMCSEHDQAYGFDENNMLQGSWSSAKFSDSFERVRTDANLMASGLHQMINGRFNEGITVFLGGAFFSMYSWTRFIIIDLPLNFLSSLGLFKL